MSNRTRRFVAATTLGELLLALIAPPPGETGGAKACARTRGTLFSNTARRVLRFPGRRKVGWRKRGDTGRAKTRSPRVGICPRYRSARKGRARAPRGEGRRGAW